MLLPSKSKSLGQYNTKSRYVSKKAAVWMGLLTDQISLKKYFMLILGVTFLVPSQYCFPRLQLHITKKYEIIFVPLCFYLRLLKKGSKSVSQISQTGISNIFVHLGVICYVKHLESGTHFCTQTQSKMCSKQ